MTGTSSSGGTVPLPERLDRPGRFGPFPSGAGAVRFLVVGGVGSIIALEWGALLWLPFLGGGLFLGVYRIDGESPDERLVAYVRWRWRGLSPERPPGGPAPPDDPREAAQVDGAWCGGFVTGGLPVAFLPPADAERLFRSYRELLRTCELDLSIRVDRAPLHVRPLPPGDRSVSREEREARAAYAELLRLLVRQRRRRRTYVRLWAAGTGAGRERLRAHQRALAQFLSGLEIPHRPLRGREIDPGADDSATSTYAP